MIIERGNAALKIRVEVEFDALGLFPNNITRGEAKISIWLCHSCGSLVGDAQRHADFHYAIATRIGEGPAPGFKPL